MSRAAPFAAVLLAIAAAWLSQGTVGFAAEDGPRLAVLPLSWGAAAVCAAAGGVVLLFRRAGASLVPVTLLALLLLPWLPIRVPAAFLLWTRPLTLVVWAAVVLLLARSVAWRPAAAIRSPRLAAAAAACLIFSAAAWRAAPMVPGGDEPHYLVITQSLLLDRDLSIEDVHRRGDYRAYFSGDLPPHVQRRGRDGAIYSIHAPGLPALVLVPFAVGGYPAVVVFLVLLASAGSALAWHLGWLATRRESAAWFGWAAVTVPVTAIFQSFTVYPDGAGGVIALTGLWALLRSDEDVRSGAERAMPWFWHGAALSLLPWLHSRFAVLAGGFGALVLLRLARTRNPAAKAVAFLAVPAVSAILWVGFFVALYGTPDPSAPYAPGQGAFRFVPGGLAGLLFDQRFGLVTYAPVLLVAFAGIGLMLARPSSRRLALEMLFVVLPYLLTVTHFAMWWGGWSPPARFFAPVLGLLAVPAAIAWAAMHGRLARAMASAALVLTALASAIVVGIDRGRLAFNTRDAPALWLEWFGRAADLSAAAPMWARDTDLPLFRAIACWAAALAAAWALLRVLERRGALQRHGTLYTAAGLALALAAMAASSAVWAAENTAGTAAVPSQLQLLDAVAREPRAVALQLAPPRRLRREDLPARLQIGVTRPAAPRGRDGGPLFALPPLPAGRYRLSLTSARQQGWVMIGLARDARDPFAIRTLPLASAPVDLLFPLPVRALVLRGDEDASRHVRGLLLQPLQVLTPVERLTGDLARRAARYGDATVFFLDEGSYPEPEAFWVAGAHATRVAVQRDAGARTAQVRLRNAPVDNRVVLSAGGWQTDLQLTPGEERTIAVPLESATSSALVRVETSAGFRPADHDPSSRDRRFLGVWVRVGS